MRRSQEDETESLTHYSSSEAKVMATSRKTRLTHLEKTLIVLLVSSILLLSLLASFLFISLKQKQKEPNCIDEKANFQPSTTTEDYHDYQSEDLLSRKMTAKETEADLDFRRRFPRSSNRRITHNLPRPLRLVATSQQQQRQRQPLSPEEKASEVLSALDTDGDDSADPWELYEWMVMVQHAVYTHALDDQWEGLGRNETLDVLSWGDYQSMVNPYGVRDDVARKRAEKDRRRWRNADIDKDEKLTKHEFKYFLFPQLSPDSGAVLFPEAHADLDLDLDGRISLQEFLAVYRSPGEDEDEDEMMLQREEKFFRETLDEDRSGFLDVKELAEWVQPKGLVQAKSEVVFLMQRMDVNKDKVLSRQEIMGDVKTFVTSQVTFFGQIYTLRNLRDEVFQISRDRRRK